MLLLVTGASGVGKSTVRPIVQAAIGDRLEAVELRDVAPVPAAPDRAWRQRSAQAAVLRAVQLQESGRHLLLSGDPVAPGEVLAAPAAADLDGIAACLLDADPAAQEARLIGRGDPPELLVHHHAFAAWMRGHAADPRHMPHVLTTGGWPAMRWRRWTELASDDERWRIEVIDTTGRTPAQVGDAVVAWAREALAGDRPRLACDWSAD